MVNNLNLIKTFLKFDSDDEFYHLQIIKRKKEHPELGSNSLIVKHYYIKSVDHLEHIMPELICLCNFHNARGCINLNRRSFEKLAFQTLRKVTDQIMNKDYKHIKNAYDSTCGTYSNEPEKNWIIDMDEPFDEVTVNLIDETLEQIEPLGKKIKLILPTKNGYHIITSPFNLAKADLKSDLHKDNPTILYIP